MLTKWDYFGSAIYKQSANSCISQMHVQSMVNINNQIFDVITKQGNAARKPDVANIASYNVM